MAFYGVLYTKEVQVPPLLDGVHFDIVAVEDAAWLDRPFEEEVALVVRHCVGDKAPRLNGFPMAFF